MWEFNFDNIDYKAIYINKKTSGNGFYLDVRAIPLFYWEFSKSIIHENHDGSHTANSAFQTIFSDSGWNFVLVDFSPAKSWEGFGKGSTRKELFKRALEHYDYEFEIVGKTVYMRHMVGDDTNYMYKYKLNTSNISHATDASGMFTHIKGFGGFEQGEEDYFNNAELKRQYTSPLADVVGLWEGKPVVDGRVTNPDTMDTMMQEAAEASLMITVEGTLHDVRQMGYETAVPLIGDRVFLMDDRINLDTEIRVHSVKTTYDERDRVIACDVTFGSQSIRERRKASLNELSKNFADLITGKLKLPIISLEQIGKDMIKNIHDASSEIIFGDFGMQAISKTNPNHVFGVNSEGWYISQDGGATPRTIATAEGIYADALFAGTLWLTNDMNIESADGYLNVTGSNFKMQSKNDPNSYVEITPDGAVFMGGMIEILTSFSDSHVRMDKDGLFIKNGAVVIEREDAYTDIDGKRYGVFMQDGKTNVDVDVQRNQFMHSGVVNFTGQNYQMRGDSMTDGMTYSCETIYTSHKAKYITMGFGMNLSGVSSRYIIVELREFGSGSKVATHRQLVQEVNGTEWANVTIDLGVPDFVDNKSFYVRAGMENPMTDAYLHVRVNRISMYG